MTIDKKAKVYLGDSVYAEWDGYMIKLCTDNGLGEQNIIHLEPAVVEAFEKYIEALNKEVTP